MLLDTGNTAWLQKNVLSIVMQSLLIVAAVSIIWVAFGYSFVFGTSLVESGSPLGAVIGGFDKVFLRGITLDTLTTGQIPELLFVLFQCMFAVITPALILGSFAERVKFSGFLLFTVLWSILVYIPMAHWVWGGGFLQQMGAIDFAGGTVVHINAGISALIMALMVGKRSDYKAGHPMTPHNVTFVFMGSSWARPSSGWDGSASMPAAACVPTVWRPTPSW